MNLSTVSTEQVYLYQHEIAEIMRLLEDVVPARLEDSDQKQYKTLLEQAYVLEDRVTFEIARRQLLCLQAKVAPEHSPLETINVPQTPEEVQHQ